MVVNNERFLNRIFHNTTIGRKMAELVSTGAAQIF